MDVKDIRLAALKVMLSEEGEPVRGQKARLARRIGKSPAQISQWFSGYRTLDDETAREIEAKARKPQWWMDELRPSPKGVPSPERPRTGGAVAQHASQPIGSDAPLLMSWEDIVNGEIREEFKLAVRDEAMAPDYMPGLEIVWSTRRQNKPGRLVLVRDKHGQVHIRQHVQGREPGQWLAVPSNSAFATFDSLADGLTVLAVFKGRLEPDDA